MRPVYRVWCMFDHAGKLWRCIGARKVADTRGSFGVVRGPDGVGVLAMRGFQTGAVIDPYLLLDHWQHAKREAAHG